MSSTVALRPLARVVRGVFAGSGDALADDSVCQLVLSLVPTRKPDAGPVRVAYFGTAAYDGPSSRQRHTTHFAARGCTVDVCAIARASDDDATRVPAVLAAVGAADVVVVSGGNTLYAVERWRELGVDKALHAAAARGAVLCGGSAGAICWFDGGHTDSGDPASYRDAPPESPAAPAAAEPGAAKPPATWEYFRMSALGILPGLLGPHFDKVQSNGVLRATDFAGMMTRHDAEVGIAVDHWAALVVADGAFRVFAVADKPGALLPDGSVSPTQGGVPAVWRVDAGATAPQGFVPGGPLRPLEALLREPTAPPTKDPREARCAAENPTPRKEELLKASQKEQS